ncbi:NAD(P)-dependent oxidoreductase [Micrococcales bacterium 31B]|nr:NAD(P)-dependent oxidoreductase [Micrococcales bacterium 31B]
MRVGIIGLGEAGRLYAEGLAAQGHTLIGFDPAVTGDVPHVALLGSAAEVAAQADLTIVLTGAAVTERVAHDIVGHLREGSVYADFTTASPTLMRRVAQLVEPTGALFADVAILGPVLVQGAATPLMVSGPGAPTVQSVLEAAGAAVELIDGAPGDATAHKLVRSVLMKNLASVVIEAMEAGRKVGCENWIRAQIAQQLAGDSIATIERFERGTRLHASRRAHEMESVVGYLAEHGAHSDMSEACRRQLERLAG